MTDEQANRWSWATTLTMVVFMMVAWFGGFAIDAMLKPLFEVLQKING